MKFNELGRGTLATMLSLSMGLGLTACSRDYTVAYVYATTAKPLTAASTNGAVVGYAVDYISGALTQLANSPSDSQGRNPVSLVANPNGREIYIINKDSSNVAPFSIGTDGKLYAGPVVNITGSFPTSIAVDTAGAFLYVTFTFQLPNSKGPGGLSIFPINKDNSLGTPSTVLLGNNPVAVAVSHPVCSKNIGDPGEAGSAKCSLLNDTSAASLRSYVYVLDQEASPNAALLAFSQNSTTGALTPVAGTVLSTSGGQSTATGFRAGIAPSAIAAEPSGHFVYVTDQAANQVYTYVVNSGTGVLTILDPPNQTGLFPGAVTADPRGRFLYIANYNTVGTYVIDQGSGRLTSLSGTSGTGVPTSPTCIAIEPARGIYLYTSNSLDGTVSGEQLEPHNGGLKPIQNTPFPAGGFPTCVVAVGNGSHPTPLVNP